MSDKRYEMLEMSIMAVHTKWRNGKMKNYITWHFMRFCTFFKVSSLIDQNTKMNGFHCFVDDWTVCFGCQTPLVLPPVPQYDCYASQLYGTSPNELQMFSYWPLLSPSHMPSFYCEQYKNPFFFVVFSYSFLFAFRFSLCSLSTVSITVHIFLSMSYNFFYKNNVVDIFPNKMCMILVDSFIYFQMECNKSRNRFSLPHARFPSNSPFWE